ncbi:MAG TPA: hypothetical protein VNM90_05860 [Haliangium sp.]|nr:hypothetical protein [Haliangium sp.]
MGTAFTAPRALSPASTAPGAGRRVLTAGLRARPASAVTLAGVVTLAAMTTWPGCTAEDSASIRLVRVAPAADPDCGAPAGGVALLVEALGDFPTSESTGRSIDVAAGASVDIAAFPPATRALTVEVIGAGGAVSAVGHSMPFAGRLDGRLAGRLSDLADGAEVPVFTAPPLGACPTGPPATARLRPLVARAGSGALVAGGTDAAGVPVQTVEYYDPATARFTTVADRLYGTAEHGLAGASATALADGRVVIAGGPAPAYQIFDPATAGFSSQLFLGESRAYHAAVALADQGGGARMLVAAGCSDLASDGACAPGTALRTTSIIDLDAASPATPGPALALARIGGVAVPEGPGRVLLVGGVDEAGAPVTTAERIDLNGQPAQLVTGVGDAAALLRSGSVLGAFAPAGAGPGPIGAVVPPGATEASPVPGAPARAGVTLTALQDGAVLALGDGPPLLYEPIRNRFRALPAPAPASALDLAPAPAPAGRGPEHAAVLLDDGTVLVVGGRLTGDDPVAARAWIVRPALLGPWAGQVEARFDELDNALSAIVRDPRQGRLLRDERGAHYRILASSSAALPSEWVILAGPVFGRVHVEARLRAVNSGAAVLLGFRGARDHLAVIMLPGSPASLSRIDADGVRPIEPCTAAIISADELAGADRAASIQVRVEERALRAWLGDDEVLSCTGLAPLPAGHVGLGVIGATDADLLIDSLTARRLD